jgi:hypothetical protein
VVDTVKSKNKVKVREEEKRLLVAVVLVLLPNKRGSEPGFCMEQTVE